MWQAAVRGYLARHYMRLEEDELVEGGTGGGTIPEEDVSAKLPQTPDDSRKLPPL